MATHPMGGMTRPGREAVGQSKQLGCPAVLSLLDLRSPMLGLLR